MVFYVVSMPLEIITIEHDIDNTVLGQDEDLAEHLNDGWQILYPYAYEVKITQEIDYFLSSQNFK